MPKSTEFSLLFEVSQTLDSSLDLREVLGPVLKIIARHKGILRGSLTLLNRDTGEISIEAAYGLSARQQRKGRYRIGEGVIGQVFQTGQAAIIPRVSEEPRFLNRTGAIAEAEGGDISYISVPIKLENRVVGALSIDVPYREEASLQDEVRLLSIVGSMISEELKDRFRPSNLIGNSSAMQAVYDLIAQVSGSDATVLIRGESGTGKELVAHAIHYNSRRAGKPFIKVNCAALPESVIESELFGHEKGAFTGAVSARKGRFELADGGTLFLDEVGDLSPGLQIKLLRVLQEREFERVGGASTLKVDVRLIAATNVELEKLIESGRFRQDLYYRLNVFPIRIPPLRERKTDILQLADFFVEKYGQSNHKRVRRISTPAIDMLMSYHWPGNVRELENCVERAVLLSDDDVIHGHHLPPSLQTAEASGTAFRGRLKGSLAGMERELILEALKSCRGNMAGAARALGISERIMGLRVRKYGIDIWRFRQ
jgi:Nif-specific regulatory protein